MSQPTRIYISSTSKDLKIHREVLYRSLRTVNVDAQDSMEHAVACSERTVQACLDDVAACDIYIGIFAFRYGYVPQKNNPEQQSITEMEYRHAVDRDKTCLIFLAKPDDWPHELTDACKEENGSGARIKALRRHLSYGVGPVQPYEIQTI